MTKRVEAVRTCVGCRARAAKSDLLRVVAVAGSLIPDPRGRMPGRGAHVHPNRDCLALAERRRAFGRALRLDRVPDGALVRAYVEEQVADQRVIAERADDNDERSMSNQR